MPSMAQAMVLGAGRTEGDTNEGSLGVMVLGKRLASTPLTPSIARGGVLVGTSWREGSVALGASEESSLALTSVGNGSRMWGEPLL